MRYEDTSGSPSSATAPEARDDADSLANGSNGPATGNVITGAGTTTGKAGADTPGDAHVVAVRGAGGTDTSDGGASLNVDGRYGSLVMDEHGNYKYVADGHAPQNFRDLFQYTLADSKGQSVADLVITRGGEIKVSENAQQIVPGPDGVVTLPPGVDLSDVHVVGRNLVVNLPDGQQIVIVDGAVFVPQLVLGGVEVPSSNLAALLIDTEPKPAAGTPQSSGGNFADPVPPLDPGVPLGDLIPPTELVFTLPDFEEIGQFIDEEPEAGIATALLDDDNMAGGNPLSNVGDDPGTDPASGQLPGSGGDGNLEWALTTSGTLPAGFSYVPQVNGDVWVLQGADHVLTISVDPATGEYTVDQLGALDHPAGGDENNLIFTINYTVTDEDGDTAVGTLTIDVDDDTPSVTVSAGSDANVILTTDDAQTIGAASDSDVTTANFSGVFSGTAVAFGADGAGPGTSSSYTLAVTAQNSGLTSHGATINLFVVGGVVVGTTAASAGAIDASNTIFTVSTTDTGIVTLTQLQQIDHPAENPSDAPFNDQIISLTDGLVTLTRSETVVDGDGDSVTGSASVNIGANLHFTDDGPTISLADRGEPTLSVDESAFATNDTQSFAANFTATFGADGPAAAGGGITYALGINAGATGLVDSLSGQAVVLSLVNGQVVGTAGAGGPVVFTVSVDASGNVTLDQSRAVIHTPDSGPDQTTTLAADDLVTLTGTATDFDGDTDSSTLNIGLNLTFHDDAPTISLSGSEPSLTVDETVLATNASDNFAGAFASAFGADGAGTITYALNVLSAGANSGLIDVATGQPIVLVKNASGVVEGHVGNAAGAIAFTVTVDAGGNVTLDQIRALQHPNPADPDDRVTLGADNLISLTATVTDKDGDSQSATLNIGQNLNFEDDGPSAINDTDTVPSGSITATGNVITGIGTDGGVATADNVGADQPGHITAIQGADGTDTTFSSGVLSIHGAHGTLAIDADGNYTYSRDAGSPGTVQDVFTYTLTDADGDSTTATLTININDSAPTLPAPPQANLDDDVIPGLNGNTPGGTGDDPPDTVGQNVVNGTLVGSGGDGDLDYFFSASQTGLPAGFTVGAGSDVDTLLIVQNQGGNPVTVLTIQLNNETGAYTVTQNANIWHPAGSDENNVPNINVTFFAQDVDGSQSPPATLTINVDDDTPTINVTAGADAGVIVTTDDAQTIGVNTDTAQSTVNFGGVFGLTQSAGADGTNTPATLSYTLGVPGAGASGVDSGLDQHGNSIYLYVISGAVVGSTSATLAGVTSGNTVFNVTVNGSGQVTLTQFSQIDHPIADDPTASGSPFNDQFVSMVDSLVTLTASSSITDRDGDTATDSETVSIGANLHFTDDGPDAVTSATAVGTVTLDETRTEGTDTVGGTAPVGDASATIDFSVNFVTGATVNYGADGAGSVSYALTLNGTNVNSGLYALDNTDLSTGDTDGFGQGGQIVLNQTSANTITGSFNGTNYFTLTINPATGVVTFTELNNIWHPTAGSSAAALDDLATLNTALASNIQVVQTVTDFDGDTDQAHIDVGRGVFGIQDDGPRFGTVSTTLQVDNDATPSATGQMQIIIGTDSPNGGTGNQIPDDLNVSNFAVSVNGTPLAASDFTLTAGAENATTASYTFSFDYDTGSGGTATAEGTLVFNKAAGTYTVELTNGPLQGFSTLQTAQGEAFVGYQFDSTAPDNTQPAVAVTTIKSESSAGAGDGFYVQFTGFTAGNGSHETIGTAPTTSFVNGDLFSEGTSLHQSWVSVSNSSNGVGGDTVNGPDALNFTLFSSDPKGDFNTQTGNLPTASAQDMFLTFDGVDSGDDFIVVLKLWSDTNGNGEIDAADTFTTKAIIVEAGDMYLFGGSGAGSQEGNTAAALAGTPYEDVVADIIASGGSNNNDGLVIIESNDYNGAGENWQIVGAQIVNTNAGVTGSGINLDADVGASGGSNTTGSFQDFAAVDDTAPMKITNIGFIAGTSTDQNATLEFDVTIHDADGDTATTSVTVNIGDTTGNASTLSAAVVSQEAVNDNSDASSYSLLSTTQTNELQKSGTTTNSNSILMGAFAAAGLVASEPLAASELHIGSAGNTHFADFSGLHTEALAPIQLDSFSGTHSSALLTNLTDMQGMVTANATSLHSTYDTQPHMLLDSAAATHDMSSMSALLSGTSMMVHDAVLSQSPMIASAVMMPSAEQMFATMNANGVATQQNQVVGQVLADALNGGGVHGGSLDALINSLPSHSNDAGNAVLADVSSQAAFGVPFGDTGVFGSFTAAHAMFTMEHMMAHQDAAPTA